MLHDTMIRVLPPPARQTEVVIDPATFVPVPDFSSPSFHIRAELFGVIDSANNSLDAIDHADSLASVGSVEMAQAAILRLQRQRDALERAANSADAGLLVAISNLQKTLGRGNGRG